MVPKLDILLVDDDTDFAEATAESLRDDGHRVCTAKDGASAVVLASELRPDVVILDLCLPDVDGYQVARSLRQDLPATTPIIVVTGLRDAVHDEHVDLTLNKPVQSELFGWLLEYIRRRRRKQVTAQSLP